MSVFREELERFPPPADDETTIIDVSDVKKAFTHCEHDIVYRPLTKTKGVTLENLGGLGAKFSENTLCLKTFV